MQCPPGITGRTATSRGPNVDSANVRSVHASCDHFTPFLKFRKLQFSKIYFLLYSLLGWCLGTVGSVPTLCSVLWRNLLRFELLGRLFSTQSELRRPTNSLAEDNSEGFKSSCGFRRDQIAISRDFMIPIVWICFALTKDRSTSDGPSHFCLRSFFGADGRPNRFQYILDLKEK